MKSAMTITGWECSPTTVLSDFTYKMPSIMNCFSQNLSLTHSPPSLLVIQPTKTLFKHGTSKNHLIKDRTRESKYTADLFY